MVATHVANPHPELPFGPAPGRDRSPVPTKLLSASVLELCAGGGGQAIGVERAGFEHAGLVEVDADACETLRANRPLWEVIHHDLFKPYDFARFRSVDLLAGGLPCPPFSVAGKQLGERDERNLFTRGVELVEALEPRAVMFENVRGMLAPSFAAYRMGIERRLRHAGYVPRWRLLNASDYGVPQLRPRVILVALRPDDAQYFTWPSPQAPPKTVGETLIDLMSKNGWPHADEWASNADTIAPTVVGGSKKHGGPDLGPTRARKAWEKLGVNGKSIANEAPDVDFSGLPRLTVRMVARIQGFPDDWEFAGRKTSAYRQVGNAFPPPVAHAVAHQIRLAISRDCSAIANHIS